MVGGERALQLLAAGSDGQRPQRQNRPGAVHNVPYGNKCVSVSQVDPVSLGRVLAMP